MIRARDCWFRSSNINGLALVLLCAFNNIVRTTPLQFGQRHLIRHSFVHRFVHRREGVLSLTQLPIWGMDARDDRSALRRCPRCLRKEVQTGNHQVAPYLPDQACQSRTLWVRPCNPSVNAEFQLVVPVLGVLQLFFSQGAQVVHQVLRCSSLSFSANEGIGPRTVLIFQKIFPSVIAFIFSQSLRLAGFAGSYCAQGPLPLPFWPWQSKQLPR